jgi:hypothetical protein
MSKEGNRPREALTSSEQELRVLVEAIPALACLVESANDHVRLVRSPFGS